MHHDEVVYFKFKYNVKFLENSGVTPRLITTSTTHPPPPMTTTTLPPRIQSTTTPSTTRIPPTTQATTTPRTTTTTQSTTTTTKRPCNIGLVGGECMYPGDEIYSCHRCFKLVFQHDGNLVVYTTVPPIRHIWHTETHGKGANRACMQTDGNFVLYTASNSYVFHTNTHMWPGAYAEMQWDGQFSIYRDGVNRYHSGPIAGCVSP